MATFTPRSSDILISMFTHSPQARGRQAQCIVGQVGSHLLLFVDSLLNRCYLLVSGSVRVRVRVSVSVTARARVSARVTVTDRDRI